MGFTWANYFALIPITTYFTAMYVISKSTIVAGWFGERTKIIQVIGVCITHLSWLLIFLAFFVIDQYELRAAGFFNSDAPYATTGGLVVSLSLPVVFPLFYLLALRYQIRTGDDIESNQELLE